jgi:hypothetical protein
MGGFPEARSLFPIEEGSSPGLEDLSKEESGTMD